MADNTQYLNYGDLQIELLDLMDTLANQVNTYVNSQPWSKKRKDLFMSAYSDLINRGISGASNETGLWTLSVGGTDIPWNTMGRKSKEMYQEAAYFIQLLMAGLPTRASIEEKLKLEEEAKKKALPIYDNNKFQSEFALSFLNENFGGSRENWASLWDELDARDAKGIRGRQNRAAMLAKSLKSYKDSFDGTKYNFEGGPFKNAEDFKARLLAAIDSLTNTPDDITDDNEALNALGLNPTSWFYNGSGDEYVDDYGRTVLDANGKPYTYGGYLNYLKLQEKTKLETEAKAAEEKLKTLDSIKIYTSRGRKSFPTLEELLKKYGTLNGIITTYQGKSLQSLTQEENDDLVSLFLLGHDRENKLNLLEDSDWELLKAKFPTLDDNERNNYRKILGLDRLYYNTRNKNLILLDNGNLTTQSAVTDFLANINSKDKLEIAKALQVYLNNTEWTADLWRELGGIAADVVSVIDPEPISAGISALTGTGLRTWNKIFDKDRFTWSDAGHTALDVGLSLLGMIPIVGDAALTARILGKLLKAAGWIGTVFAAALTPLAAKAAWDKVINGKDLSVDDWRAIGNVFMGLTLARRIQLNRAAGNVVKNSKGRIATEKVSEVEVKIGDNIEKVKISNDAAKELKSAYLKAGNNLEETSKALRKSREVRSELEAKKTSDGQPLYTKELLDTIEAPQAAAGSIKGQNPFISLRPTRGITPSVRTKLIEGAAIPENSPLRILYAVNNQGLFGRSNYGWNINGKTGSEDRSWIRRQWDNLVNPYNQIQTKTSPEVQSSSSTTSPTASSVSLSSNFIPEGISSNELLEVNKALGRARNYKMTGSTPLPNPKLNNSEHPLIDGSTYKLNFDGNQTFTIEYKGKLTEITGKSLLEAKLNLGKEIDRLNSVLNLPPNFTKDSTQWKNMVKSIKLLKRAGYFMKEGGKLDILQIDNFLKKHRI